MLEHWHQGYKDEYGVSDLFSLPLRINYLGTEIKSGICFYNVHIYIHDVHRLRMRHIFLYHYLFPPSNTLCTSCTPLPSPPSLFHVSTASPNISLHLTRLFNLANIKKAPLSFRCKLYVSSGGGASLSRTITGINSRTRSVTVCPLKSYTSGAETVNGSASVRTEVTCASTMAADSKPVR